MMIDKRKALIVGSILAVCIVFIIGIIYLSARNSGSQTAQVPEQVPYTSSITGQGNTDIPAETPQVAGLIPPTEVQIGGLDSLNTYLTNPQVLNVVSAVDSFLMARSGLANVQTAIQNDSTSQSGTITTFTLVVQRPQATYQVSVQAANQYQSIPDVTFKQVE